jgi:ATP-dependent exoDNAse (exonuclease V) beta subunit
MPATQTAINPQGYEIVFDEASHTYTTRLKCKGPAISKNGAVLRASGCDENDKTIGIIKCTSGTSFVHHFFPEFDPDGIIASRKARERGVTADQIRFEWKQNAAEACAMGTRVHETCADVLKNRRDLFGNFDFRNKPKTPEEQMIMAAGFEAATEVKNKFEILGIEQIVFDIDVQIAGTIDLLARDNDTVWILDWKTNKKIEFENHYKENSHALYPISHLYNCSGVQYGLQLSTYEFLMKKAGYFNRNQKFRRGIFHLTPNGYKFYELPDYAMEVRDMAIAMLEQPPF